MIKKLNLSEIIQNQAVLNVGCIGHVSNGKVSEFPPIFKNSLNFHQSSKILGVSTNL